VFASESGGFRWDAAFSADRAIRSFLNEHLPVREAMQASPG
jgi:hypothetical protein